jgi:hypothetical protein
VGLKRELAEYGGGPSDDPPVIIGSNGDTHISSNGIRPRDSTRPGVD